MHTRRTIALIGTGILVKALALALLKRNNRLLLFSRFFEEAENTVAFIKQQLKHADIEAVNCSFNASWEADIIITAVNYTKLKEIETYISDVAVQKIFIIANIKGELSKNFDINEAQKNLPYTYNLHAFLNIDKNNKLEYALSGNDSEALNTANQIFEEAGMYSHLNVNQHK